LHLDISRKGNDISRSESKNKTARIIKEVDYILLLKKGQPQGMSQIYDRYAGPLYGVINRICPQEEVAKDALQDTFVKIWNNRSQYDQSKAKLFTWMYTIARRTALDHLRRMQKIDTTGVQIIENHVSQSVRANLDTMDIHDNVDSLEPKYRDVLYALFFNGYTQREWSDESGLPLGTVKSRLRIAMRQLRSMYLEKAFIIYLILQLL